MKGKLIISDPAVKLGRPVVAGTRVTVDEVLDLLAAGISVEEVTRKLPGVTEAGVLAALKFAADAVRGDHPIEATHPLELHGARSVELPGGNGEPKQPAVAVRAFLPEACSASVVRLPEPPASAKAWLPALGRKGAREAQESNPVPMERIHPAGVFEALFVGESEPFSYRLEVAPKGGKPAPALSPYGIPPRFAAEELAGCMAGPAPRWHRLLGAHVVEHLGLSGVSFAVWAPHAQAVGVIGDFNDWREQAHPLRPVGGTGVWELFVPGIGAGQKYKYRIAAADGRKFDKADPCAFSAELRPGTASIVTAPGGHGWGDVRWVGARAERQGLDKPIAIYEVHLGSWRRKPGGKGQAPGWYSYRELADRLVPYVAGLGYTHIEPMPVSEHPLDRSWGYQTTGLFAPTARYGSADDFRYFVDRAHQAGLGVILDWVPAHFPKDAHGLAGFDGTPLFEHADARRSENLEWGTLSFNLDSERVSSFLLSNALYWIEEFHVDGLRVDAVSSMIYLDYSRQHWVPNEVGGRENLEAAAFLQRLNALVHSEHPGVLMIAEESTAWPHVTRPSEPDSLGFDLKWNLGWMHDTLNYAHREPIHRRFHQNDLTFSLIYAFNENFLLPFSHDEVVHGKRSLLGKMPGDDWQRLANLRAVYGYMYAHPGKKLHFMGSEFGPPKEWDENAELDWSLLEKEGHRGLSAFVRDLNRLYASRTALHQVDFGWEGFQWLECNDAERSTLSFLRKGARTGDFVVVAVNFTPVARKDFRLGVPSPGAYAELLNSDAPEYGGSGIRNPGPMDAEPTPFHGQAQSVSIDLPPLAVVFLAPA